MKFHRLPRGVTYARYAVEQHEIKGSVAVEGLALRELADASQHRLVVQDSLVSLRLVASWFVGQSCFSCKEFTTRILDSLTYRRSRETARQCLCLFLNAFECPRV